MARVLWKGAISFSLVHIPVTLYSASRARSLDFDMLDRRDFAPIGYHRYNKSTGEEVAWGDIVKGYEYEKGKYVVLSDADFKQANVKATRTIDIQAFVERAEIAPHYFETPYYLQSDRQGQKVYELLREALERSGRVALALIVIRTRQSACVLYPMEDRLVLNTLRFAEEIAAPPAAHAAERGAHAAKASPKELSMATKLIEDMAAPFDPSAYHDTYRQDLMRLIESRIEKGQTEVLTEATAEEEPEAGTNLANLSELLRRSLDERKAGHGTRASARHRGRGHTRARRRA
jgi:DNA end-binding protein Ku